MPRTHPISSTEFLLLYQNTEVRPTTEDPDGCSAGVRGFPSPMSMSLAQSRNCPEKKVTPYSEKGCRLLERPDRSKTQMRTQHRQKYTGRLYTMIQLWPWTHKSGVMLETRWKSEA